MFQEHLLLVQLMNIGEDIIKLMQYHNYSEEPWKRLKNDVNIYLSKWQLIKKHETELTNLKDYPKYKDSSADKAVNFSTEAEKELDGRV